MMLKKMTRGQRAVIRRQLYVAATLSRLSNLPLSRCSPRPFVVFCLLGCSGQRLCAWCSSAGHFFLSWGNRTWQWLCQWKQTLKMLPSCSSSPEVWKEACFFLLSQHGKLPFQQFLTQGVQLSHVTLWPFSPSAMSIRTLMPWFFSGASPGDFPVYTCIF